jgi:hypothetical protein
MPVASAAAKAGWFIPRKGEGAGFAAGAGGGRDSACRLSIDRG